MLRLGSPWCSGFFVAPRLFATAGHCAPESDEANHFRIHSSEQFIKVSEIFQDEGSDISLLTLSKESAAYFETASVEPRTPSSLISYDANTQALATSHGSILQSIASGVRAHSFDTGKLSSGGVLIQAGKSVGIHLGALADASSKEGQSSNNVFIELRLSATVDLSESGVMILPERDVCGPQSNKVISRQVPEGFDKPKFGSACQNHDACYGTRNKTKNQCDKNFLKDL